MSEQKSDPFKPRIYIDNRGRWFQDGVQIKHRWTYLYNNRLLSRDSEGRYCIDEGRGKMYVEVQDTPFVVKMIDKRGDGFYIFLNDETEERLDFDTLRINRDNVPYAKVKQASFEARFLRPAYYELMKHLNEEGDKFYIQISEDERFSIPRK